MSRSKKHRGWQRLDKINIDKSEISDDKQFMNIGGIVDTADKGIEAIGASKDAVVFTAKTAVKTGKKIQTGVVYSARQGKRVMTSIHDNGIKNTAISIAKSAPKTAVKTGMGLAKNVAKGTATGIKTAVKSGVTAGVERVESASINKQMVYDTGVESTKYAITQVRRTKNVVKAIKNTKKAAQNSVTAIKTVIKIASSKATWILLAIVAVVMIYYNTMSMMTNTLSAVVTSTFGWAVDDTEAKQKKVMQKYIKYIDEVVEDKQKEVDNVYYKFNCDRIEYGDHHEITEFRDSRFTYQHFDFTDQEKADIISMAATKWYSDYIENHNTLPADLKLSKNQIKEITEKYFNFEYHYEYDYCPHYSCCHHDHIMTDGVVTGPMILRHINSCDAYYCDIWYHGCKEITQWINKDSSGNWDWNNVITGQRTFCDNPNHRYLCGKAEKYDSTHVMIRMGFTPEQKDMYNLYAEQIAIWLTEPD